VSTLDVTAPDISCEHCKHNIETDLATACGVSEVSVDVATKAVHVVYDASETSPEEIRSKLEEIGYPAS